MARSRPATRRAPAVAPTLTLVVGVALGLLGPRIWPDGPLTSTGVPETGGAPGGEGQVISVAKRILKAQGPSRTVYLNREGAALRGGPDDSAYNVSSVVANSPSNQATVPAFAGSASRWRAIAKCIRKKFLPFDMRIVEQRPVEGDYIMAVLGGTAKDLGFHKKDGHSHSHATGLAPFSGEPIANAVIYVFTRALRENARVSCETAGMEIAHAYGLDHARHCKDLMTYMRPCGARTFLDRAIPCGERKDRPCSDGGATQNSYRQLLSVLGAAPQVH